MTRERVALYSVWSVRSSAYLVDCQHVGTTQGAVWWFASGFDCLCMADIDDYLEPNGPKGVFPEFDPDDEDDEFEQVEIVDVDIRLFDLHEIGLPTGVGNAFVMHEKPVPVLIGQELHDAREESNARADIEDPGWRTRTEAEWEVRNGGTG